MDVINWESITDNFLHIVAIDDKEDPYYWNQSTIDIRELTENLLKSANISKVHFVSGLVAVFCWILRNLDRVKMFQHNNYLCLENVVVLESCHAL
jgi:hypothetical protein